MSLANARRILLLVICCGMSSAALGQDPTGDDADQVQRMLWRGYYRELAPRLRFETAAGRVGELQPEPLLSYYNPAGGIATHGSLFVWTVDDRPLVIGALWSRELGEDRQVAAELHSTELDALRGVRDGVEFWTPRGSLAMQRWTDAGQPAGTPQLRLTQMRGLARRLKAIRTHKDLSTDLRPLTQPLYRYENDAVVDGAVFGFFDDWDPELFLLVEARADDPAHWSIGFFRLSDKNLQVTYAGNELWSYDPTGAEPKRGGGEHLYVFDIVATRSAVLSPDDLNDDGR